MNAGGKVAFKFAGLHNVVFAPKGEPCGPVPRARPRAPGRGVPRTRRAPTCWFNGAAGLVHRPAHVIPSGDKVIDGKALDTSGIFQGQGAPPDYVVSFPEAGPYAYLCTIHPGMKGTVKVLPGSAKAPSRPRTRRPWPAGRGDRPVRQELAAAGPRATSYGPATTAREVAFLAFFPAARQVPVGDDRALPRCRRTRPRSTTSCSGPRPSSRDRGRVHRARRAGDRYDPLSVYPSDPGALALRRPNHGNGFLNTGLLDADPRTRFPRFASGHVHQAGSYAFICTVHGPSMKGRIDVRDAVIWLASQPRDDSSPGSAPMQTVMLRLDGLLRRRSARPIAWAVLVLAAVPFAARQSEHLTSGGFGVPGSQSAAVDDALDATSPGAERASSPPCSSRERGATRRRSCAPASTASARPPATVDDVALAAARPRAQAAAQAAAGGTLVVPLAPTSTRTTPPTSPSTCATRSASPTAPRDGVAHAPRRPGRAVGRPCRTSPRRTSRRPSRPGFPIVLLILLARLRLARRRGAAARARLRRR